MVDKDVRLQEQDKRRATPRTMYTKRRRVDEGRKQKEEERKQEPATASIEGMQRVLRAVETGSGKQEGSESEGRGGRDV